MFYLCLLFFVVCLALFYIISGFVAEDIIKQLKYGRRRVSRYDLLLALDWVVSGVVSVCYAVLMVIV